MTFARHAAPSTVVGSALDRRSALAINVSVALFGLAGVLGNQPAALIVLSRVGFGSLTLVAVAAVRHSSLRVRRSDLPLLIGQGLVLAIHWTAFFQSILVSSVAIGLLSFSTFPLFTAILEWLLLGTRPERGQILAAVCIVGGVECEACDDLTSETHGRLPSLAARRAWRDGSRHQRFWPRGAGATD